MKKKTIFIIAIVIILMASIFFIQNYNKELLKLNDKEYIYELGDDINIDLNEYLDIKELNDKEKAKLFDNTTYKFYVAKEDKDNIVYISDNEIDVKELSNKAGKYIIRFTYKDEIKETIIDIKDTIKPEFIKFKDNFEVYIGSDYNFIKDFEATDLSGEVKVSIDKKDFDYNIKGTYTIEIIAEDLNGNKSIKEASVIVKEHLIVQALNNNNSLSINGGTKPSISKPSQDNKEPEVHRGSLQDVINTAYSFVGGSGMTCDELIMTSYNRNGYYSPSGTSWDLGYSVGTDINVVKPGDVIITKDYYPSGVAVFHSRLVVSFDGTNVSFVEGGGGPSGKIENNTFPKESFYIYDDTQIVDIRRVFR